MTKVIKKDDCRNSPKNELLQAFCIAVARKDLDLIADLLTDDVVWHQIGRKPVAGSAAVAKAITQHGPATTIRIDHAISHGKAGSVDGIVEFGGKHRAFCHVFEFRSAKGDSIKSIRTYSVRISR